MDSDRASLKEGFELETFAKEKQKDFFSHVGAREERDSSREQRGKESEEEEEEEEVIEYDRDVTLQEDMKIMKDSQRSWQEDKYLSGGNVTVSSSPSSHYLLFFSLFFALPLAVSQKILCCCWVGANGLSARTQALVELDEYEREDEALVITMKNIHKTYLLGLEGVPALRGVSMSVRKGEFLTIFGTSGGIIILMLFAQIPHTNTNDPPPQTTKQLQGGKTSLLNIMGTIDKPTKGNMKICGTRMHPHLKFMQLPAHPYTWYRHIEIHY